MHNNFYMITIPEIYMPIVRDVRTKDERDKFLESISGLEAALFRSSPDALEKILSTQLPEHTASVIRDICARPEFKNNSGALRALLRDVKNTLDAFLLLKLTFAFKPSEEMINRLHEWTQQNLGMGVALDIGYDASILGGARIIFNGKYKEMTLAQMITETMAKEKATIMGMIT